MGEISQGEPAGTERLGSTDPLRARRLLLNIIVPELPRCAQTIELRVMYTSALAPTARSYNARLL